MPFARGAEFHSGFRPTVFHQQFEPLRGGSQPTEGGIRRRSPEVKVLDLVTRMIPPQELIDAHKPTSEDNNYRRDIIERFYGGADAVLLYSPARGKLELWKSHHPMARNGNAPATSPTIHYARGLFEGLSGEPTVDPHTGLLSGANLVLLDRRLARMEWSLKGKDAKPPVPMEEFRDAYIAYSALLGDAVYGDPAHPTRAYGRPFALTADDAMGIALKPDTPIIIGAINFNWPSYFAEPERIYRGPGVIVVGPPIQRTEEILGKHAGNYSGAGRVSQAARAAGGDDALYFGTHTTDTGETILLRDYKGKSSKELASAMTRLEIADGPGEEVFAITKTGEIWYPPLSVGRLGGTTLEYVVNHIAPELGIPTLERTFSVNDLIDGEAATLVFAGNAVYLAPFGEMRLVGHEGEPLMHLKLPHPDIVPNLRRIQKEYEGRLNGKIPTNDNLLTPIPRGKEVAAARAAFDEAFEAWT